MFKKMQLKLTIYYSVILIAAIFSMSALLYFFVYEFSSQNLLSDVKSDLDAIIEEDWTAEPAQIQEAEVEKEEQSETDDDSDDVEQQEEQAQIDKMPSLLSHFSTYRVLDMKGGILFEHYQSDLFKEAFNQLESEINTEGVPQFVRTSNGDAGVYIGSKSPIYLRGELKGSYIVLHDVSQTFKTLNELLNILLIFGGTGSLLAIGLGYFIAGRAIKPVSAAYNQKQIFLENVSHEMRTPLSAIMLNTELLEINDSCMTEEKQESYAAIKKEVNDLRMQIGELLNKERTPVYSKFHNLIEINLSQVLESEVNRFRIIAKEQDIKLKTLIQPDLFISAQERDVVNVFRILIDNAIKYSYENSTIEITLTQKSRLDNEINFQLVDHGCGIDPTELPNIFKRDYRSTSNPNQTKDGYGLGLSIVDEIIMKIKAKIEVKSTLGEGTTFVVRFFKTD